MRALTNTLNERKKKMEPTNDTAKLTIYDIVPGLGITLHKNPKDTSWSTAIVIKVEKDQITLAFVERIDGKSEYPANGNAITLMDYQPINERTFAPLPGRYCAAIGPADQREFSIEELNEHHAHLTPGKLIVSSHTLENLLNVLQGSSESPDEPQKAKQVTQDPSGWKSFNGRPQLTQSVPPRIPPKDEQKMIRPLPKLPNMPTPDDPKGKGQPGED